MGRDDALCRGQDLTSIGFAIGWPVVSMFHTAFLRVNAFGLVEGSSGFDNFRNLFGYPAFVGVV